MKAEDAQAPWNFDRPLWDGAALRCPSCGQVAPLADWTESTGFYCESCNDFHEAMKCPLCGEQHPSVWGPTFEVVGEPPVTDPEPVPEPPRVIATFPAGPMPPECDPDVPMGRCGSCRFWGTPGDIAKRETERECQAIKLADGQDVAVTPLAYVTDAKGEWASLMTRAGFGCVAWQARDEGDVHDQRA